MLMSTCTGMQCWRFLDDMYRVADLSGEVQKLRPPRYIQSDGIIRSYVFREAEGHQILQVVCNVCLE